MVFRIPDDPNTLLTFGESRLESFSQGKLRVLVWNVWKGKTGERWRKDFLNLVDDRDLVLLQEAVTDPEMSNLFRREKSKHEWHMAASFAWRFSHTTGVMTGALVKPSARRFLRGAEREFFVWTPKVTLGTCYRIEARQDLLVLNTHVVNFTTTRSFVRFVEELLGLIEAHQGPVLLAGDFNTWNPARFRALMNILKGMGLTKVDFHADPRFMKLDHVFTRGMRTVNAHVRADVQSSDHYPLLVEFEIPETD